MLLGVVELSGAKNENSSYLRICWGEDYNVSRSGRLAVYCLGVDRRVHLFGSSPLRLILGSGFRARL